QPEDIGSDGIWSRHTITASREGIRSPLACPQVCSSVFGDSRADATTTSCHVPLCSSSLFQWVYVAGALYRYLKVLLACPLVVFPAQKRTSEGNIATSFLNDVDYKSLLQLSRKDMCLPICSTKSAH